MPCKYKTLLIKTRVLFSQTGEVLQDNSYYPFGMSLGSELTYNNTDNSPENKYLYSGKERQMDFGLDWYDYGARFYDPSLGRFTTIDPLAEYAFNWTPYRYGFNNPFVFNDPTGMIESQFISDPYLRHLKGLQEERLAEEKVTDTMIELKGCEIIAKKPRKEKRGDGFRLTTAGETDSQGIRKSAYDSQTINLDDIMKYMGFTPGRFSSSPLDIAGAFLNLLIMLQIYQEVEPPVPVTTTDKKIKENSTGTGKTPDETGKDSDAGDGTNSSGKGYYEKVTALHWSFIKYYGNIDSTTMTGPVFEVNKTTGDTVREYSWGQNPENK